MTLLAIAAHLIGDAGIGRLVGTRVFPFGTTPARPAFPYITLQRVSGTRPEGLDQSAGIVGQRMDINCWANSHRDAAALGEAVRQALHYRRGILGNAVENLEVTGAFLKETADDFEPPIEGSNIGAHRVRLEFMIWHRESVLQTR